MPEGPPAEQEPKRNNELIHTVEEKLGHISMEQYQNLPRKTKKAAKKQAAGKALTQLELSRLSILMRHTNRD